MCTHPKWSSQNVACRKGRRIRSTRYLHNKKRKKLHISSGILSTYNLNVQVTALAKAAAGTGVKASIDISIDPKAPIGAVPPKDVEAALKVKVMILVRVAHFFENLSDQ